MILRSFCSLLFAGACLAFPDHRSTALNDLSGYFPMVVPATESAWKTRAEHVRRQVAISQGLYPMPAKAPLKAQVFGERTLGDYRIAKVVFEAMPGFYVTGSLFRPVNAAGKLPGVLCPHGHWPNGRHMERNAKEIAAEIASGAEALECSAKNPLQARCVHLARMGMVVFHYDMLGYADSQQLTHAEPHTFKKQTPERAGLLFSPLAEGRLQSVMGLQSWVGIRALDFLTSLAEVDSKKLGVTGASGGGTQKIGRAHV